eukprot:7299507-Karenia_brevis.AAC.1
MGDGRGVRGVWAEALRTSPHGEDDLCHSSLDEEVEELCDAEGDDQILEPWQDGIRCVTHSAEDVLKNCKLDDL